MRFVLVLLAVMGLLFSPAAAAAAQAACHDHSGQTMMDMPMAGMSMAQTDGAKAADPCCDPGKDQGGSKHDAMSCLQACAVMCGIVAALPAAMATPLASPDHSRPEPTLMASLKRHEPGRLERPPRSIA